MSHFVKHSRVSSDHLFSSNHKKSYNSPIHNRYQKRYLQNNTDNSERINQNLPSKSSNPQEQQKTQNLRNTLYKKKEMLKFYKKQCFRRKQRFETDWQQRESILVKTIDNITKLIQLEVEKNQLLQQQVNQLKKSRENKTKITQNNNIFLEDSLSFSLQSIRKQDSMLLN